SVIDSISDVLVVCDLEWRIEAVNESLCKLVGQPCEALTGQPFFHLLAEKDRALFCGRGTMPPQEKNDCECQMVTADGTLTPVSFNCTVRRDASGRISGVVITGRPVGELRRAYEQLRQAHEQLQRTQRQLVHSEKMASLGRLVAGVAHELNNPISFVLGNVYALKRYAERFRRFFATCDEYGALPEELQRLREDLKLDRTLADLPRLIAGLEEGAQRSRDIVDALKRFSAVDGGERHEVDFGEVIRRSVHWVQSAVRGNFRVTLDLPDGLRVWGNSGQLQQVVMNLVQNAADATAGQPDGRLTITAAVEGDGWRIDFVDNGPGIAPEHLPHIFEPFFTTKPVGQGMGLGLAISYGLVEKMGGRLSAENNHEGGAIFTLWLPMVTE
ncbi:PAS domain-containing sensor histidine kinase, partial [Hydrogenophilus islandicus]